jgi:predicted  nucleic acid-binding Zn-ribbon protein
MADPRPDDDPAALRAEIDRLRELVGPTEQSYVDLRRDLLAARDAATGAEASAGVLRGRVAELEVELARARQDQEHFQQAVFGSARSARRRLAGALRARLF